MGDCMMGWGCTDKKISVWSTMQNEIIIYYGLYIHDALYSMYVTLMMVNLFFGLWICSVPAVPSFISFL